MIKIVLVIFIIIHYIYDSIQDNKKLKYIPKNHINKVIDTKITIEEIKSRLPKKVFKRNTIKSMLYFFRSIILVYLTYTWLKNSNLPSIIKIPLHALLQGTLGWSLFLIAHDCGHGGFSKNKTLNYIVGLISNTPYLIPYYPWRLTHKNHHKNTGDLYHDEVHFPQENDSHNILKIFFGWIIYCYKGGGSRNRKAVIDPTNELFKDELLKCYISFIAMGIMIYIIIRYRKEIGLSYYLPSLVVLYGWIVFVTIMHHHDETNVWKKDPKAINGIIEAVDRHYGIFHNITHNVGTHQVHHLCPQIPHYNLPAATLARKEFPNYVKYLLKIHF